jgi:hypothetical protein
MRATVVVEGEEMLCDCGADIISKLKKKRSSILQRDEPCRRESDPINNFIIQLAEMPTAKIFT